MSVERRVELTSSAWLFSPERLFYVAGKINKGRPADAQVAVELYPTHNFKGLPMGPGRIDLDRISAWQKEHGPVPVERIHLPFWWDARTTVGAMRKEPPTGLQLNLPLAYMLGTAKNGFAQELASELGAGLNAHVNLVEAARREGKVDFLRGNSKYVWVENDVDYRRKSSEEQFQVTRPSRAIEARERFGLEGVIMGVDHYFAEGIDPFADFAMYRSQLEGCMKCVHLAGEGEHGLILDSDHSFWGIVEYIKNNFQKLSLCLDLSPIDMRKLTQAEQVDYIRGLVERLER